MIYYLVTREHPGAIRHYLATRGAALKSRIRPVFYDRAFKATSLPAGAYVFADVERLSPDEAENAGRIWHALERSGRAGRLLNHPTRSMRRYEMLRWLYETGSNVFNVYRVAEARRPQRFPVFVRHVHEHTGSLTPLLRNSNELARALETLETNGRSRENLMIVEFCDTSNSRGIFHKYSAFFVGDQVIARHLQFSTDWVIKMPNLLDSELLKEELRYVEQNPHEKQIRRIFELARLDYGRLDYSMLGDRLQVWEINTNSRICTHRDAMGGVREPVQSRFLAGFESALRSLDSELQPARSIPIPATASPRRGLRRLARSLQRASGWRADR